MRGAWREVAENLIETKRKIEGKKRAQEYIKKKKQTGSDGNVWKRGNLVSRDQGKRKIYNK